MLHRRRHAVEITHGPQADVEIEQLSQTDVQRCHPATDGRGQWPFDTDKKFRKCRHRFFVQPAFVLLEGLLTGINFHPVNFLLAAIGFLHRGIEYLHRSAPNIAARAIAFDERNDRIVGNA